MTEKQQMMSERVGNWWRRFEWCILNAKIGWSSNKFKIMPTSSSNQVQNAPFKDTSSIFNPFRLHLLFFMHLLIILSYKALKLKITTKWTLKMLELGMVSSFHPHCMRKRVERVTTKTGRTSCTIWTISFGVSGFRTRTRRLHGHFIF